MTFGPCVCDSGTVLFQHTTYHSESLKEHTVNVYKTEKEDVKDINYCLGIFFFLSLIHIYSVLLKRLRVVGSVLE